MLDQLLFTCPINNVCNKLLVSFIHRYLQTNEEDIQLSDRMGEHLQHAGHIRKADITARKRINELLMINALTILFNFIILSPECHRMS